MAKSFEVLKNSLNRNTQNNEIYLGKGVIFNQYPEKYWLAEDLVALPVNYI